MGAIKTFKPQIGIINADMAGGNSVGIPRRRFLWTAAAFGVIGGNRRLSLQLVLQSLQLIRFHSGSIVGNNEYHILLFKPADDQNSSLLFFFHTDAAKERIFYNGLEGQFWVMV